MRHDVEPGTHHVVMMSSGAGSAAAGKLVAQAFGTENLTLLFADVNYEHPDNYRFLRDAAEWIGGTLVIIDNDGLNIWDVFKQVRFLGNSRIDPCSRVLKREPMRRWLENHCDPDNTICYLGFDWTEEHRMKRAAPHWEPWRVEAPMTWEPVCDKGDALDWMRLFGVEPPLLTRLGFPHANCGGGCVKAGIKQFKKLYEVLPETFAEWEAQEEHMRQTLDKNVSILVDRKGGTRRPLPLSELRQRIEAQSALDFGGAEEEWGACNCFTPVVGEDGEPT